MTVYNDLLNTHEDEAVEEIINQEILAGILENQSVDGYAVDLQVYGSSDFEVDPDAHFEAEGFSLDRWSVDDHSHRTLVVDARATAHGLIPSSETGVEYVSVRGILKWSVSLSEANVSGTAKLILAPA